MNSRTLMSDTKFYEAYSRYIDKEGRYETWEESIDRVMNMHHTYYKEKMTQELSEMMTEVEVAYKQKLFLGAQRGLQFGGEQLLKNHNKLYNCFSGDTEFVSTQGNISFNKADKESIYTVPTHKGRYQSAVVKSYGKQQLYKIIFSKGTSRNIIQATRNHRWLLENGTETTSLKVGDKIIQAKGTFQDFKWEKATIAEKKYWIYGMVYGDGTISGKHSHIRLCKNDAKFAYRFEELGFKTSSPESLCGDIYAYTGTYLKTAPNPKIDSVELIRAFVAGYLQADGEKNKNFLKDGSGKMYISIQSSQKDHIDFIRNCFSIAGIFILNEQNLTGQQTNFGTRPYTIKFSLYEGNYKQSRVWTVKDIKEANIEEVWCLEVENDKSFTLPNGMITGNCASTHCDRPEVFGETMHLLLSGAGVGFSVQKQHIKKMPHIAGRLKEAKTFVIEDSIEGWAEAIDVLLSSFFKDGGKHPEYKKLKVYFDFTKIRPKGALISGGFKAPGPEPLRKAMTIIEELLISEIKANRKKMRTIVVYDIMMHLADAVISGGVRRSATICMFSHDDEEMIKAKTGDWFISNPQRGRSNNSVMLLRGKTSYESFAKIMESVQHSGEPGFIWVDNLEFTLNPCVEVGMLPTTKSGKSGFQVCNLTEINGGKSTTEKAFMYQCKVAAIMGTLQAGYTDFKFLSKETKEIVDREALIGVGITGIMNNPQILTDKDILIKGAEEVKKWNKITAKLIGINQAARTTVIKPSGNASVILETASGIHGEHSPNYLRHVQLNRETEVAQLLKKTNPAMCSDSVWGDDMVAAFPITSPETSIYKNDLLGVKQLEYVKLVQNTWIEAGTNIELCADPLLRHNVSNTITVDDWGEVTDYIYTNRASLCGVSMLSAVGDKAYPQAPFTEILTHIQIVERYGEVALFTSALIEAALSAFNADLWNACNTSLGFGEKLNETHEHLLKRDFTRRFKKFSKNFKSEEECANCLKDVYNLHKWWKITGSLTFIEWEKELHEKKYTEVDTTAAQACAGGSCEIV